MFWNIVWELGICVTVFDLQHQLSKHSWLDTTQCVVLGTTGQAPIRMPRFLAPRTERMWAQQEVPEEGHWCCFPSVVETIALVSHPRTQGRSGLPMSESKMKLCLLLAVLGVLDQKILESFPSQTV